MLKADISDKQKGGTRSVHLASLGDVKELTDTVCIVINGLYSRLKLSSIPELADLFRQNMILCLMDPNIGVWDENRSGGEGVCVIVPD